ncbi:lipopolysaccharide biosynthesis protein [Pelagibius sp. Alg239-R121]|uniref:lipopolysaccharide biosynthesis protein n=1 Tax=Pelagibius sp. Alg239-R121 TaxID=2993448 RepID=UPI0024A77297|nr:lipopolysaccharide biosynthesis protein [Pelagibius sp. Alg239-R121]
MSADIKKRIAVGAGWMVFMRLGDRLIGLVSMAVLARLLLPADFGLVGYAIVLLAILEIFAQLGVENALIHDQKAPRESYDTAWTMNICKGLVLSVGLLIAAKPAAVFFEAPQVEAVIYVLAILPFVSGIENIGTVDFRKDLAFHKDFIFNFLTRFCGAIVTICLAFILRDHWALVIGMILRALLRVVLSYVMSEFRPRLTLSRFSEIFNFSKWIMLQNLLHGFNERLPALVIGRLSGPQALAFFNIGFEIANLASTELAAPIRRALFPGFAKMNQDRAQLADSFRWALSIIVLVGLPIPMGIAATADYIVPTLLGWNWLDTVPIIQILCFQGAVVILGTNSHLVYLALGKPAITAWLSGLRLLVLVPCCIYWVGIYGAVGAGLALVASAVVVRFTDYAIVLPMLGMRISDFAAQIWRPLTGVLAMNAVVRLLHTWLEQSALQPYLLPKLAICVVAGAVTYLAVVIGLWLITGAREGAESYILGMIRKFLVARRLLPNRDPA